MVARSRTGLGWSSSISRSRAVPSGWCGTSAGGVPRRTVEGPWTEEDDRIASPRQFLTTRAALWVTFQVGRFARSVNEVATESGVAGAP